MQASILHVTPVKRERGLSTVTETYPHVHQGVLNPAILEMSLGYLLDSRLRQTGITQLSEGFDHTEIHHGRRLERFTSHSIEKVDCFVGLLAVIESTHEIPIADDGSFHL